jgi:sugar phosphate isomerase/epimerase
MAALERSLQTAVDVGVKGVQPWVVGGVLDPDNLASQQARADIVRRIESYGLTITALCAHMPAFSDPDGLQTRVERTKKALKLSVDLGAPIITGHAGTIPQDTEDPGWKLMAQSLGEVAEYGAEVGACMAMEPGREGPEVLRHFIETIDSPGVMVNFDSNGSRRFGLMLAVDLLQDYIVHTHAKDGGKNGSTVGTGLVPWDEYIAKMKAIGYDGWYAIEDERGGDVVESIRRGREFLEKY